MLLCVALSVVLPWPCSFGLSRALVTGQTHRSTHSLGTVSHMAPELLRFGKMSPAVDVFAFGIMSECARVWQNVCFMSWEQRRAQ